jgi:hypothetical protein
MTEQKFFPENSNNRFKINRDVEFLLEIIFHPHIVIAHKKMNGDTAVGDFCKFAQYSYISFGNDFAVLNQKSNRSPMIKITAAFFYFIQECNDAFSR